MNLDRTHDMGLVRAVLAHPAIWPHIHDDGVKEPAPVDHASLYWMLVTNPDVAGVFLLHPHNTATYEVHTCLLPVIWGAQAKEAAQLCRAWMFTHTPCQKLITHVPAYNAVALRFARQCGFTVEGLNRKSFLRNGVLLDQHVLGLTKEEWQCQQQSQQ